ncbi:MAG: ABC transporter permease [Vicinamibacterales bacterium]
MKKLLLVARREFLATAATKAFIFAVLITPAIILLLIVMVPRMIAQGPPDVRGEVAVLDPTGQVASGVRDFLRPDRIAARRQEVIERMNRSLPAALRSVAPKGRGAVPGDQMDRAMTQALGAVPRLDVVSLEPGRDVESEKRRLAAPRGGQPGRPDLLALVVIHRDAVAREGSSGELGAYDLFVRGKLDDRITDEVEDAVRTSIVDARLRVSGLDPEAMEALTTVERVTPTAVTAQGEGMSNEALNTFIPAGFMALLLVSVMMSGQYLLTTTVEEKSSRVVEVLLSAVSPMELMAGKIAGQLAVGLVVLALYLGLGILALISFASLGLLDPMLIVFMLAFFLLAYVSVGAFMAAIGAAVNEMREAQGMMTPVMVAIMIPWILWMPLSRDPNSAMAVALSFLPPISNFVMMLRLASAAPPPIWQPLLAIVVGAAGAWASLWFAAKVFRIGLLMYGKPPNFATLIRWVRLA